MCACLRSCILRGTLLANVYTFVMLCTAIHTSWFIYSNTAKYCHKGLLSHAYLNIMAEYDTMRHYTLTAVIYLQYIYIEYTLQVFYIYNKNSLHNFSIFYNISIFSFISLGVSKCVAWKIFHIYFQIYIYINIVYMYIEMYMIRCHLG